MIGQGPTQPAQPAQGSARASSRPDQLDPRAGRGMAPGADHLDPRRDRTAGAPTADRLDPRVDRAGGAPAGSGRPDPRAERGMGASAAGRPDSRVERVAGAPTADRPDPRDRTTGAPGAGRPDSRAERVAGAPVYGRPDSRVDRTAGRPSDGRPDPRADRFDSHGGRPAGVQSSGRPDPHADRFDPRAERLPGAQSAGRPDPHADRFDPRPGAPNPGAAHHSDRDGSPNRPATSRGPRPERSGAAPVARPTTPTSSPRGERNLRAESTDDVAAMLAAAAGAGAGAPAGLEFRSIDAIPTASSAWTPRRDSSGHDRAARRASSAAAFAGARTAGGERPGGAATSASKPKSKRSLRRAVATRVVSTVAMGFAAMLAIATSVPSLSLLTPEDVQAMALSNTTVTMIDGQRVEIAAGALAAAIDKGGYEHQTIEEYARAAGIRPEATFTNNPLGTIQWPFAVGVHIGDRFGYRDCAGCSSNHHGQDFNPGLGAQIQSIADGVVSNSTDAGGSLGVVTMIDHVIDGEVVTSVYAHMEYGSRRMEVGDTVKVGDVVGTTGNTGMSTGPHLHFEIRIGGIDGVWVDPLEWLYANTN
ncbi:peptidoglycan DD-metalloendopeptidase family protein [Agromyces sp. NPDC056523]|uniref:M23 family metallopeptidase n=1 Tax=Agromyces sp. NPDC056523 TaxID=3345850 RepID=UPI0036717899